MEKAAGYKRLTEPPCNFNFEEIARRYGWGSSTSVRRLVDLLDQPEPIQEALSRDRITETHVRYQNPPPSLDMAKLLGYVLEDAKSQNRRIPESGQ